MTLSNAKVLYAHFLEIGREAEAEDLLRRYPELEQKPKQPVPEKETPKKEVKKDGKKPKR